VGNDGLYVTPKQAKTIATKLTTWLKGGNLVLDLSEEEEVALAGNKAYFDVFQVLV
jgi:hypothetical protein